MRKLSLDNITATVVASFDALPAARRRERVQALVTQLHQFAKDVRLTHAGWRTALRFLHRGGDISRASRSEFSWLSDVTGLSSLVDMRASAPADPADPADPAESKATPGSVLRPFHTAGSPWMDKPADRVADKPGRRVLLRGRVCNSTGPPLPDATLDFWQNAADGLYGQQDPNQAIDKLRCPLTMDAAWAFEIEISTIRPVPDQIPRDGPVWHELVAPAGLSGWRPAHFYLIVQAPGHRTLATELFDAEDPGLDSDAVFGVREPLVGRCETVDGAAWPVMQVELRLAPAAATANTADNTADHSAA